MVGVSSHVVGVPTHVVSVSSQVVGVSSQVVGVSSQVVGVSLMCGGHVSCPHKSLALIIRIDLQYLSSA